MIALDPLTGILKKHLRGTKFDHDQATHGSHGVQANTAPLPPGKTDVAFPAKLQVLSGVAAANQVFSPQTKPLPPFTGKAGSQAEKAFTALAKLQAEINDSLQQKRAPNMPLVRMLEKEVNAAIGKLSTYNTPANRAAWLATHPGWDLSQPPPPDPLFGPREHYLALRDELDAAVGTVTAPIWMLREFGHDTPPPIPGLANAPGQPVNQEAFEPWKYDLPQFVKVTRAQSRNIYHALGTMQAEINRAAASGTPINAAEYKRLRAEAVVRLKGLRGVADKMLRDEAGGKSPVSPEWTAAVADGSHKHYAQIMDDLDQAASYDLATDKFGVPQLAWRVHEFGEPLPFIPGLDVGHTQRPPSGLKLQFADPPATSGPAQDGTVDLSTRLWGGIPVKLETNLSPGPANPLTTFMPHDRAYAEAGKRLDLDHSDAFDMHYQGATGKIVIMYHGAGNAQSIAKNGLRWGAAGQDNAYGQGIYTTDELRVAQGYGSALFAVEVHTGRTIDYSALDSLTKSWKRRNPALANRLNDDEAQRLAAMEAGYSSIGASYSGDTTLVVLDPARVRILGVYDQHSKNPLSIKDVDDNDFKSPPRPTPTHGLTSGSVGWRTPIGQKQTYVRNPQVSALSSIPLSDEAFKILNKLETLRQQDTRLQAKFTSNIAAARNLVNRLMPIRTMASTETLENIVRSGGLWSRDAMTKVAAALEQSAAPEMQRVAADLKKVVASPLFNPSDKALGLTGVAQLAFGPPMVNSKTANQQGTGYGTITLVAKRAVLAKPGITGSAVSVSGYSGGQAGAKVDETFWKENTHDAVSFREVVAQRLAMGMGLPWSSGGHRDDFHQPRNGLLSKPDDYLTQAPMFTSETPEVYVAGGVPISEFSHLLIEKGTQHTVKADPISSVPEITAPSIARDNQGQAETMVADKYVQFEQQATITDHKGNTRSGKLWDGAANLPMSDKQIEAQSAEWFDGATRQSMRKVSYGMKKVGGVWHFITQTGKSARTAATKQVDAVKYFTKLFADMNIDIRIVETDPGSSILHSQYAGGRGGNTPYEDIIYGQQGVSV